MEQDLAASALLAGLFFWFVILVIPTAIGGLLHEVLIQFVPPRWTALQKRFAFVSTTPVILLPLLPTSSAPELLLTPEALIPIVAGLVFYGLLARPARNDE